jgi:hypothetical protein
MEKENEFNFMEKRRFSWKLVGKEAEEERQATINYIVNVLKLPRAFAEMWADDWIKACNEVAKEFGEDIEDENTEKRGKRRKKRKKQGRQKMKTKNQQNELRVSFY